MAEASTLDGFPVQPGFEGSGPSRAERDLATAPSRSPRRTATRLFARLSIKRVLLALGAVVAIAGGARYGLDWWTTGRFLQTTDDAFLQADKVTVAPKVGGFVAELLVTDNQPVEAGQVLARIDDRDYRVVLLQDEADLDKAKASLEGVASALIQQQARISEAEADVQNCDAALAFSKQEAKRYGDLFKSGAGTTQRLQQASADLLIKQSAYAKAEAALDAARKQTDGLRSLEAAARASLRRAEINLQQAHLNIGYTTITAPIRGVVGDRSVRKGQLLSPGTNLMTIVPMGEAIFLVANFKETQVGDMHEGQPADVTVDAFGGHVFHGHVISFSPGTGSQFALLPPENATGNFTKVVQRVPIKIALDPGNPMIGRLRPGLSAEATVDTRNGAAAGNGASHVSAR